MLLESSCKSSCQWKVENPSVGFCINHERRFTFAHPFKVPILLLPLYVWTERMGQYACSGRDTRDRSLSVATLSMHNMYYAAHHCVHCLRPPGNRIGRRPVYMIVQVNFEYDSELIINRPLDRRRRLEEGARHQDPSQDRSRRK